MPRINSFFVAASRHWNSRSEWVYLFNRHFSLNIKRKKSGQNAVQFMIITAVILTVVGIVAINAGSEFEKTLALSSAKNTATAYANDNGFILREIQTNFSSGHYNFTIKIRNDNQVIEENNLKVKILEKIAVVLNQPTPTVNPLGCALIAHYTYCVKFE